MQACINPAHLMVGTSKDNTQDMLLKDRQNKKLTTIQVLAIRSDRRTSRAIATEYGVGKSEISAIRNKTRWAHLP